MLRRRFQQTLTELDWNSDKIQYIELNCIIDDGLSEVFFIKF